MVPDHAAQQRWLAQWREAAAALAAQRKRELREMSAERGLAATESLLELGAATPLHASRLRHSGLVEQQALLHRQARK